MPRRPRPDVPTRREALAAFGLAAASLAVGGPAAAQDARRAGPIIRTLLKDVAPEALAPGAVLFHEHLSMRFPLGAPEHFTDDVPMMVEEARAAVTDGIACLVDGGHADMARSLDALRRIATESGLPVVASGGYYMQRSYPEALAGQSADAVADALVAQAAAERWGALGEIGQQDGVLTAGERVVFEAVAKTQRRTGLPIFTHNPYMGARPAAAAIPRDAALRQLDVLERAGARPDKIAIGHVCCLDDPKAEIAIALARRGVFVGFDRVTLPIVPDAQKVVTLMALVEAGHAERVLISSDFAAARALKARGGPGLAQAATVFGPMLRAAGMPEATLARILQDNPRRFLAFTPPA
jgi:phosphotriesterase-related protein